MIEISVDKFPDVVYVKLAQKFNDKLKTIAQSINQDTIAVSNSKYPELINFMYESLSKPVQVIEHTYWHSQDPSGDKDPIIRSLAEMYIGNKNETSNNYVFVKDDGKWISIKFNYNEDFIKSIKEIKGRKFDLAAKTWLIPSDKRHELIDKIHKNNYRLNESV